MAKLEHLPDKIVSGTGNIVAVDTVYGIKSVSSGKWLDGRAGQRNPLMSETHRNPKHDRFLQWKVVKAGNGIYALNSVSSSKWLDGRAGERDPFMSATHRNPTFDSFLQWTFVTVNGPNSYIAIRSVSSAKWLDGRAGERDPFMSAAHRNPQNDHFLQWVFVDPWEIDKLHQQQINKLLKQQQENQRKVEALQKARKNELISSRNELVAHKNELEHQYNQIHQQLADKMNEISTEKRLIQRFEAERNDNCSKVILLSGNSGDGKSTFGNRLCGDSSEDGDNGPFETSDESKSCTQQVQKYICGKLTVVDCPGWNDSGGNDKTHLNNLCSYLRGCGGINNFVLIRNSNAKRFDADFQKKLRIYDYHFGKEFWKHLIVVLTHVDQGVALRKFNKSNKVQEIKRDLSVLCNGYNNNIPVIAMGLMDNFKDKLNVFIRNISNGKFVCHHIRSPIDDLVAEQQLMLNEERAIKGRIDVVKNKIDIVKDQINNL